MSRDIFLLDKRNGYLYNGGMANIKEMYDKRISILTTAEDRRKLAALKIVLGQSKMEIVRELIRREYEARVKGQSNGQASR